MTVKRSTHVLEIEYVEYSKWLPTAIFTSGVRYRAQASQMFSPPPIFTSAAGRGLAIVSWVPRTPARWITASTWTTASVTAVASRMSPRIISSPESGSRCLSNITARCPRARSSRTVADPMKPAPPVTRTFTGHRASRNTGSSFPCTCTGCTCHPCGPYRPTPGFSSSVISCRLLPEDSHPVPAGDALAVAVIGQQRQEVLHRLQHHRIVGAVDVSLDPDEPVLDDVIAPGGDAGPQEIKSLAGQLPVMRSIIHDEVKWSQLRQPGAGLGRDNPPRPCRKGGIRADVNPGDIPEREQGLPHPQRLPVFHPDLQDPDPGTEN